MDGSVTHKPVAMPAGVADCYIRVERSARLEQAGYDQVALPVVNGVSA